MWSGVLLAQVAILVSAVGADQIRWINPAGGVWQHPANWDGGQVPGPTDTAVFDLAADYMVTLADHGSVAAVTVKRGRVSIDLGEFNLIQKVDDSITPRLAIGSPDEFATLTVVAGQVFEDGVGLSSEVIVGAGQTGSLLEVDSSASLGFIGHLSARSQSVVIVNGHVGLHGHGQMVIEQGASLEVAGTVSCRNAFSKIIIDGTAEISGTAIGSESSMIVRGELDILSGSDVRWFYLDGSGGVVRIGAGSAFRTEFISDLSIDLRGADASTYFRVADFCCDAEIKDVCFYFDSDAPHSILSISVSVDDFWAGFSGCVAHVSSVDPISVGEERVVTHFVSQVAPQNEDLVFVADVPHPSSAIVRLGLRDPGAWSVSLLGVPEGWNLADLSFDGEVNFFDIAVLINEFNQRSPWANINNDFAINFFDIAEYLDLYLASQSGP